MEKFVLPSAEDQKSVMKSIRMRVPLLKVIEEISKKTGLSINKLINLCIEFAISNMEDLDKILDKENENTRR